MVNLFKVSTRIMISREMFLVKGLSRHSPSLIILYQKHLLTSTCIADTLKGGRDTKTDKIPTSVVKLLFPV